MTISLLLVGVEGLKPACKPSSWSLGTGLLGVGAFFSVRGDLGLVPCSVESGKLCLLLEGMDESFVVDDGVSTVRYVFELLGDVTSTNGAAVCLSIITENDYLADNL